MTLSETQLDDIERAAKKATPGKWFTMTPVGDASVYVAGRTGFGDNGFICGEAADERDAEYIATMDPATTLALVAEVRELRAQREKVIEDSRQAIRRFWGKPDRYADGIVMQADVTLAKLGDEIDMATILNEVPS